MTLNQTARLCAIFLTVLTVLSACSRTGTGADSTAGAEAGDFWDLPMAGVSVPVPAAYSDNTDKVYMEPADELYADAGISYGYVGFYPASWEEIGQMDEDSVYALIASAYYPLIVFGIDGGRGEEELSAWLKSDGWDAPSSLTQIGTAGEWSFFRAVFDDSPADYGGEIGDIARQVSDSLSDYTKFRFSEPQENGGAAYGSVAGRVVTFSTEDVYGNPIDSAELFAANEITMVNIWTSWCPPCQGELPALAELHERLREKNCGIVGILYDAEEGTGLEDGVALMESAGITYPVLIPDADIYTAFPLYAYPTTYFVDSAGQIVGDPIVGAYIDRYEPAVDELLK